MSNHRFWSQQVSGCGQVGLQGRAGEDPCEVAALEFLNTKQERKSYEILQYLASGRRLVQPPTCTIDLYKVLLKCETKSNPPPASQFAL